MNPGSTRNPQLQSKPLLTPDMALNVLRRWWSIVIPSGLVVGAVAAAIVFLCFTPVYEANVLLWIAEHDPYLVAQTRSPDSSFAGNQLGLIRSTLVLGPAVSRQEIASLPDFASGGIDPIDVLRQRINVAKAWGTEHYFIRATSPNPANAAAIANVVAESYLTLLGEYQAGRDKRLIELLERERDANLREIEVARENVRQLTVEQTGRDPFGARKLPDEAPNTALTNLQGQLTTLRVEASVLRLQITGLEEYLAKNPPSADDAMIERFVEESPQVRQHRALIESKRNLAQDVRAKAIENEQSPRYVELESQIKAEEEVLAGVRQELRKQATEELAGQVAQQQQNKLTELKVRLADYAAREAVLGKAYEDELAKAKHFSGETLTLEVKRAELERANSVMDRIAQRAFMLRTEQSAPARVEKLEAATIPKRPVENWPYKKMLLAFGAAFTCPYLIALLWDMRLRGITSADQVEEQSEIHVVGEIANLPLNAGESRYFGKQRASRAVRLFEESVESLRIGLVMHEKLRDAKVLAVCSAATKEGKTTLSAQLAISMARSSDGLTLLVDGDMRAPDMHVIFDVENTIGLAEVLEGNCSLDQAVVPSWDPRLHVLPAGELKGRPHELVRGGAFNAMIAQARQRYDYIIIDTPPVLPAGESLVMAAAADATLICIRRDVSRLEQLKKTRDRLVSAGAKVAGCVFSGIPMARYEYRYGGYYHGERKHRE